MFRPRVYTQFIQFRQILPTSDCLCGWLPPLPPPHTPYTVLFIGKWHWLLLFHFPVISQMNLSSDVLLSYLLAVCSHTCVTDVCGTVCICRYEHCLFVCKFLCGVSKCLCRPIKVRLLIHAYTMYINDACCLFYFYFFILTSCFFN